MQQAVASSQFTLPPSSIAISALNRHIIRQRLKSLLETLNESIQELNLFDNKSEYSATKSTKIINNNNKNSQIENDNHKQLKLIEKNFKLKINKILSNLIKESVDGKQTVILDGLLQPIISNSINDNNNNNKNQLASTFYENRFGFTPEEILNCEFKQNCFVNNNYYNNNTNTNINTNSYRLRRLASNKNNKTSHPINDFIQFQQTRGFKTKRSLTQEQNKNDSFLSDLFKKRSDRSDTKPSPMKVLDSLLSSSSSSSTSSSSKRLGSILQSSRHQSADASKLGNSEFDNKVKIAFAEGVLYAKQDDKKPNTLGIIRFLLFIIIMAILFSSVSISTVGSSGNGKNGGGINIRALTGSVNFEVNPESVNIKFDDVKGLPEAKKELSEIVDFLKDPEKYTKLGARLPKGVLLVGPPGCGKTLLAKSVAGEAGVPFFQASGSDFDEMFVGTGSKRVRQLFTAARARAPCVIFIDEIDSVGSTRTNSMIHPHANQTINQLLAEMDGFQKNEGVIVLGATNRRETLDSALMRPGRFDLEVRIDRPDLNARIEILEYYLDKVAKDDNVNVEYLARQLTGLGGSAIENVVNQAALRAVVTNNSSVKMEHLEWALDRALMGYGKSRLLDEECNKNTAYHEAGHVLVAYFTKDSDPLHKVTILPRAQSLGHTAFVPDNEGYSKTKSQLLAQMDVAMGGRVAEEIAFGSEKVTTGAANDFQKATQIAMQMVKILGMSEKVGPRVFFDSETSKSSNDVSPQTQELLDQEIKKHLQESYDRAKTILKTHSVELKILAEALLQHETLDVDQIKKLIESHKL